MCDNCYVYLPEELVKVEIELLPEIESKAFLELFDYSKDDKLFEDLSLNYDISDDLLLEISRDELLRATSSNGDNRSNKRIINKPVKYLALKNGFIRLQYECKGSPSLQYRNTPELHNGYVDFKNSEIIEMFCSCRDFFYRVYYDMTKRYKLSKWRLTPRYKNKMLASVGTKYDNKRRLDKPIHFKQEGPFRWTNAEGKLFVCKHLYDAINRFIGPEAQIPPLLGKPIIPGHRQQYYDQKKKAKEIEKNLQAQKTTQVTPKTLNQVVVNPEQQKVQTQQPSNVTTQPVKLITTQPIKTVSNTIKPITTNNNQVP